MAYNVFLDINILVDFFVPGRLGHEPAKNIFDAIEHNNLNGFFSESVVNTTSYLIRKSIYLKQFNLQMREMLNIVTVLPCTNNTIKHAYHNAKNDLEDAVLYQIALENEMDYFLTGDIKDFKRIIQPSLPVVTAKEMISIINKSK